MYVTVLDAAFVALGVALDGAAEAACGIGELADGRGLGAARRKS